MLNAILCSNISNTTETATWGSAVEMEPQWNFGQENENLLAWGLMFLIVYTVYIFCPTNPSGDSLIYMLH